LTRFTNNKFPKSLNQQIERNFNYYWANDRIQYAINDKEYLESLPRKLRSKIMTQYLFTDLFKLFKKFFIVSSDSDERFLYDIAFGFMPRMFEATEEDQIIYDEEEEVPEMYFMTEGVVGIGFSLVANGILNKKYHIAIKQKGV